MLQTHTPSCFSNQYVLLDNGKACGKFKGRAFSSGIDVSLLQRYRLTFKHEGLFSSRYSLVDQSTGSALATAQHAGLFTSAWDLSLQVGECRLVSAGFWNQGFYVEQGRKRLAEVNVTGGCSGTWYVRPYGEMPLTDQVMTGLVFHTILQRRRAAAANS
ncbi:MAG: hypothetical protein KTR15_15325 [Phycisphaeraceae bacterium]|nr:hypothetical protein [Phycisphaeraceae bacterium]